MILIVTKKYEDVVIHNDVEPSRIHLTSHTLRFNENGKDFRYYMNEVKSIYLLNRGVK